MTRGPSRLVLCLLLMVLTVAPATAAPDLEAVFADPEGAARSMMDEPTAATMIGAITPQCTDDGKSVHCAVRYAPQDIFASFFEVYVNYGTSTKSVMVTMRLNPRNTSTTTMHRRLAYAIGTLGFPEEVVSACTGMESSNSSPSITFGQYGKVSCTLREDGINGRNIQFRAYAPLRNVTSTDIAVQPETASHPEASTWPGMWKVTPLPDGRLHARVSMRNDGIKQFVGVSTFGVICVRGGGLKIGFESVDGTRRPSVVLFPQYDGGWRFALADNEIRGSQAETLLADLLDAEKHVQEEGHREFWVSFATESAAADVSQFNLAGLSQVVDRLKRDCSASVP